MFKGLNKSLLKFQHNTLKSVIESINSLHRKLSSVIRNRVERLTFVMYTDEEIKGQIQEKLNHINNIPSGPFEQKGPINIAFKSCEGCAYLLEYHKYKIYYEGKAGIEMLGPGCNLLKLTLSMDVKNKIINPDRKCPYI